MAKLNIIDETAVNPVGNVGSDTIETTEKAGLDQGKKFNQEDVFEETFVSSGETSFEGRAGLSQSPDQLNPGFPDDYQINSTKLTSDQSYELEKKKLYFSFLKWVVISVVFGWVSMQFKQAIDDRKQGTAEIGLYDDYLKYVTGNNLEQTYQLARYFASVTATDKLREGWARYYNLVDQDYKVYRYKSDSAKSVVDSLGVVKASKKVDSVGITKKLAVASQSLSNIESTYNDVLITIPTIGVDLSVATVYIQFSKNTAEAKILSDLIKSYGCKVPPLELLPPSGLKQMEIRYFNLSDKSIASELQSRLAVAGFNAIAKPLFKTSGKVRTGTIELWLK